VNDHKHPAERECVMRVVFTIGFVARATVFLLFIGVVAGLALMH